VIYSGSQFDLGVVKAAIDGDVLSAHQAEIQLTKSEPLLEAEIAQPGPKVRTTSI
jgi:hypothetical protein